MMHLSDCVFIEKELSQMLLKICCMDDKLMDVVSSVNECVKKGVSVTVCFSMIFAVREEMLVLEFVV